jgi:hypothetical protein
MNPAPPLRARRWDVFRRRKYAGLLLALLLLLVLAPAIHPQGTGRGAFNALFTMVLLAAAFAVARNRVLLLVTMLLGVPAIAVTWAIYFASANDGSWWETLMTASSLSRLAFLSFVTVHVLWDVLQPGAVTTEKLCGAVCVYLLIGLSWAFLYAAIAQVEPNAFRLPDPVEAEAAAATGAAVPDDAPAGRVEPFLYYSFVTLTTLGYGDLTPLSPRARVFSWLEAVTGQLYVAILIARLVGLHVARLGE